VNAPRQLGLGSATALVVANMIGTGVFTTSGFLLADLGSPWRVLLAWLVGGLVAGCGALSYGALARRIPESGGEYLSSRARCIWHGLHRRWISLLVDSPRRRSRSLLFRRIHKRWLPGWPPQASGSALPAFARCTLTSGGAELTVTPR
jgi:APA family basic amino acid/polyamine antiporter